MYFLRIVLLIKIAQTVDIKINGELTFDVKISNINLDRRITYSKLGDYNQRTGKHNGTEESERQSIQDKETGHAKRQPVLDTWKGHSLYRVTAAAILECVYQYPEQVQVDALLSNMMNQLTKVYTRAQEFMKSGGKVFHAEPRHIHATRYSVVQKKGNSFFENIYNNMTQEYKKLLNNTTLRVDRARGDPCTNQQAIRKQWLELLDASLLSIRRASRQCLEEYFKTQKRDDPTFGEKLEQFLVRELAKVKMNQLHMLCNTFQLCYNDLL